MTNSSKKHHYVPQFYLKRFGTNEGIFCFDKVTNRSFGAAVNDVAHENKFYEIPNTDGTRPEDIKLVVEDYLAQIDARASRAIKELISTIEFTRTLSPRGLRAFKLDEDLKFRLTEFMIFQSLRTKENRESIAQMSYMFEQAVFRWFLHANEPEAVGKVELVPHPDRETFQHLQMLTDEKLINRLFEICLQKLWVIGYNETKVPLITSDNPVVRHGHSNSLHARTGWDSPLVEFAVPLSDKIIIILNCPSLLDRPDTFAHMIESVDRAVTLNELNIQYYNHLQYRDSYRFLFSSNDSFADANSLVNEQPIYTDPFRKRIDIHSGSELRLPADWSTRHRKKK